jgi:serine/threonine-protein kinase
MIHQKNGEQIGKTISHYKIMGVVYKAQDTKLKRTVALKFLPPELTRDPEAKERFVREAQAASALDHPNIGTIYDINETKEGQLFIAMACYEGETLKQRIERGPSKIKDSIKLATQVAEGLANAHEQGIIHRDIKPANVMVTGENRVKILDFGLAKLQGQSQFTKAGTTLGTVAYMSPEQLRGEDVDHRTDIWSLGVLIYEMVTGRLPFKGDYEQAVTYAILNEDPEPMTGLRTGVPMNLEGIVVKAMAKEPTERYQHADEIPVDLKAIKVRPGGIPRVSSTTVGAAAAPRRSRWQPVMFLLLVGFMVGAVAAGIAVWRWIQPTPPTALARFALALPATQRLMAAPGPLVTISPDGTRFVYVGVGERGTQLFLRPIDQLDASPIPGTDDAYMPFFSPDGAWVGFFADGKLKKVALAGGPPLTITETPGSTGGASWGPNDLILFAPSRNSGLFRVSAAGGVPQATSTPDDKRGETAHLWPEILPDGKAALFTIWSGSLEGAQIGVLFLESGEVKRLPQEGTNPHYAYTDHLVYGSADGSGSLLAVPFDLGRLQVTGPTMPILEDVAVTSGGVARFSVSRNGSIVYLPGSTNRTLVLVDRQGTARTLTEDRHDFNWPRFSPDGKQVAVAIREGGARSDIWVYAVEQGTLSRLTFEGENRDPEWTPDGKRVTFNSNRAGTADLFWMPADGSEAAEPLLIAELHQRGASWSPDGKLLVYRARHPTTLRDIWVLPSGGEPWAYLQTPFDEWSPMLSPDGSWLAYTSNESGRPQVYVREFPGSGGKWQVSTDGGTEPMWAPNGRELFYRLGNKMVAVGIDTEPAFTVGTRKVLFDEEYVPWRWHTNYDIHPDGKSFVMIKGGEGSTELVVVLNWAEELKRRVPGGK